MENECNMDKYLVSPMFVNMGLEENWVPLNSTG